MFLAPKNLYRDSGNISAKNYYSCKRKMCGCDEFVLCRLSFAGFMFLRILFPLQFQVSMGHKNCFVEILEDRKVKQPYSYYPQRAGAGQGVLWHLTYVVAYLLAYLVVVMAVAAELTTTPTPAASSFSFSRCTSRFMTKFSSFSYSRHLQHQIWRPQGGERQKHRFQFILIGPTQLPTCSSPPSLSNCQPWRQTWQPPTVCFTN